MIWKPNVTVAAIIERDGKFLLVEEETGDGIMFNLPRGAKNKANKDVVTLDGDLYSVRFLTIRGTTITERGTFEMIYGDRLAALFTEQTGFDTSL